MNAILSLGRWFFAIPFALLGLQHFMDAHLFVENVVPKYMPAKELFVYVTGVTLIVVSVLMLIGKYDKLASIILALFLLAMIGFIYVPGMIDAPNKNFFTTAMLKDISLAGAAMMYAKHYAQDNAVVG